MSVIRPEFHSGLATQVLDEILYKRSNYFYFLGKIESWGVDDTPPSIDSNNSALQDNSIRNNIVYMRRVTPNESSLVTRRILWETDKVYEQWDHTVDMSGLDFYVVSSNFNVYKCLSNNNGAPSTVQPYGTSLQPFKTSDGYLWKYMYNIPTFKRQKFLSRAYMPVQKALTDTFYNKGAVEKVVILDPGSSYEVIQRTNIVVTGTTSGSGADVIIESVSNTGTITAVHINNGGSGYIAGADVKVVSATGAGAVLKPIFTGGVITGFTIQQGGIGYVPSDTIQVTVGGADIVPVLDQNGSIVDAVIYAAGAGYTSAPTLSITQSPATGVGKFGNPSAILKAIVPTSGDYVGSVVAVTIEDPGTGYPIDTTTTITVEGDGTNAHFTPVLHDGRLVDVVVDNPGSNYSYINLIVSGPTGANGTQARVQGILASSDFVSDQALVEQSAVKGAIYAIKVTNPGNNYTPQVGVTIDGDGVGATARVVLDGDKIAAIELLTYGSGYTYADIIINDPVRNAVYNSSFINASAYATLPPVNGHGYDAVKELFGDTISIYTTVRDDETLSLINQEYRQYGLIKDPVDYYTRKKITTDVNLIAFVVTVNDSSTMTPDDLLKSPTTGKHYRVVTKDGNKVTLQQVDPIHDIPSGDLIDVATPTNVYTVQSLISSPRVNKYSGNLLYVTNTGSFQPTAEQATTIRTYIKL